MYYDDESDRYFREIDDVVDYYAEKDTALSGVPEYVYGTMPTEINNYMPALARTVVDYISDNIPEMSTEDDSFDSLVSEKDRALLEELLGAWVRSACSTVVVDYDKKVNFKEEYAKYLTELRDEDDE